MESAIPVRPHKVERGPLLSVWYDGSLAEMWMAHIRHHHANSVLVSWLLLALALTIRLYRQRYLYRGTHPVYPAITLVRLLWLSLGSPHARHDPG